MANAEEEALFQQGEVIDGKFKVDSRLGRGGYDEEYAVKVERVTRPGNLLKEEKILRNLAGCSCVPHITASGRHEDRLNYFAMELLGPNLSELRRRTTGKRFSMLTTLALGVQMLRGVAEVHETGYVHRDIKPGNFVLGAKDSEKALKVYVIDYGLSKKHIDGNGEVKPKRKAARWVGSRRYMSLNTHLRKDQGRRDDLWSLLYVLIEFATGTLPWGHLRGIENLDKVRDMKMQYNNDKLVRGLPVEFMKWMNYIKMLKYDSAPDYDYLTEMLESLYKRIGGKESTKYDWEPGAEEENRKRLEEMKKNGSGMPNSSDLASSTSLSSGSSFDKSTIEEAADRSDIDYSGRKLPRRKRRCIVM